MTKKDIRFFIVFISVCGILAAACKQERPPCLIPTNVYMTVETMHLASDTATIFTDTSLTHAHFSPFSTVRNVVYLYNTSPLFNLTLSPNADSCQWLFSNDSLMAVTDTISFHYTHSVQFLSNACGFTYFYTLTSVSTTHNLIDSARININSVTNDVRESPKQVQLYIHPAF